MASLRFYPQNKKNGTAYIMAAFQNGNDCPRKYIGYSIPATKLGDEFKCWNKNTSRVRSIDSQRMAEINKKINEWQTAFDNYISACNLENLPPDINELVSSLTGVYKTDHKFHKGGKVSLVGIFNKFLSDIKSTHSDTTLRGYRVIKCKVEKFQEKRSKEVLVSDINKSF